MSHRPFLPRQFGGDICRRHDQRPFITTRGQSRKHPVPCPNTLQPLLVFPCQPLLPLTRNNTSQHAQITQGSEVAVVGGGFPDAPPQLKTYTSGDLATCGLNLFLGDNFLSPHVPQALGMTELPPACHNTARVSLFTGRVLRCLPQPCRRGEGRRHPCKSTRRGVAAALVFPLSE